MSWRISRHEARVLRCAGPAAAYDGALYVGPNQSEDFAMNERQPSTRELRLVFKELDAGPLKGEGLLREIAIRFPGLTTEALDQALEVHCEVLRCTGIRLEAEAHSMQALKDFLAQNMYADLIRISQMNP